MDKALNNKKEHKPGTKPNSAAFHGERHFKAQIHAMRPTRQAALKKKMSLSDMHSKVGAGDFEKMGSKDQAEYAKKDRDASRAAMIKKLEAAGDFESVKALQGDTGVDRKGLYEYRRKMGH